jgi:hypothetical protein
MADMAPEVVTCMTRAMCGPAYASTHR